MCWEKEKLEDTTLQLLDLRGDLRITAKQFMRCFHIIEKIIVGLLKVLDINIRSHT